MKIRLSIILKNSKKNKYKKNFIKYLSSLDFDEFEIIFNHYISIIFRALSFYKVEYFFEKIHFLRNKFGIDNNKFIKNKFLSKKWFCDIKMTKKYHKIYDIFLEANSEYVEKIQNKLITKNNRKEKILTEIININNKIKNMDIEISNVNLTQFCSLIFYQIYIKIELERLVEEFNKIK